MGARPLSLGLAAALLLVALAGCFGGPSGQPDPHATRNPSDTSTRPPVPRPDGTDGGASPGATPSGSPGASTSPAPTPGGPTPSGGAGSPSPSATPTNSSGVPATAPDSEPPEITAVTVTQVQANQATVRWTVEDDRGPVTSRAEWALGPAGTVWTPTTPVEGLGDHQAVITGLNSNTSYRVRAVAVDSRPNQDTWHPPVNFTTLRALPAVSGIHVTSVRDREFTVAWNVTGSNEVVNKVQWGLTGQYGSLSTAIEKGAGARSLTVTGLQENQAYHFAVSASSPSGAAASPDMTQRTANLVVINITGFSPPLRFDPPSVGTQANELLLVRVVYKVGSTGAVHGWELRSGGSVVAGFQTPDMQTMNQAWESQVRTLPSGTYTMRDRADGADSGTWTVG